MEFNQLKENWCGGCNKAVDNNKFYNSPISLYKKYLPLCKTCCANHYKQYLARLKNEGAALWCVLTELGIPMQQEVWNTVKNIYQQYNDEDKKPDIVNLYLKCLSDLGITVNGLWEMEYQLTDFVDLNNDNDNNALTEKDLIQQRTKWDKLWGTNYSDTQCQRLDEYFENYTKEITDSDVGLILRYRELCKLELKQFEGDDSKEVTDGILKLMKLLKIDNFQDNKKSETEKFIDRYAWRIENTRPAECEDLEKYKDYAKNESMWRDIMRTLKNAVAGSKDYPDILKDK